jgi:thioredoxin-related protein
MEEDVYSDENIGDFINDNFISYKVNAEKGNGPNLKLLYNIESFPGLLFLDHNGRVLEQKQGAAYHTELKEMANRAIEKAQKI